MWELLTTSLWKVPGAKVANQTFRPSCECPGRTRKGFKTSVWKNNCQQKYPKDIRGHPELQEWFPLSKNGKLWKLWKTTDETDISEFTVMNFGQRIMEGSYGLEKIIVIKNTRNNVTSTRIREQRIKHIAEPSLFWDFQNFIYLFFVDRVSDWGTDHYISSRVVIDVIDKYTHVSWQNIRQVWWCSFFLICAWDISAVRCQKFSHSL